MGAVMLCIITNGGKGAVLALNAWIGSKSQVECCWIVAVTIRVVSSLLGNFCKVYFHSLKLD
jgi:hypothetical protein